MKFKPILALFTLLVILFNVTHAQPASYRTERSTFDITAAVGFADKNTRDHFGTTFSAGLRKEWSLGKLISLNAAADYITMPIKNSPFRGQGGSLNLINLGGGVTIYPNWLVAKILKQNYDDNEARKDGFYIDESVAWNLNSNPYGRAGDMFTLKMMANFHRYRLSNGVALSPRIGAQTVFFNRIGSRHVDYSHLLVGVALNFGRFEK